jgi:hypothetical protein
MLILANIRRFGLGSAMVSVVAGCGQAAAPTNSDQPRAYVLRIDRLDVSSTKPGSSNPWDGEESGTDPGAGCKVLVAGVSLFQPMLAPASAICDLSTDPPRQRRASDPDLQFRLRVGADVTYSSWVIPDSTTLTAPYEVVVPVDVVPPDGLQLEALDDEGEGLSPELIGGVRVSRDQLMAAYRSPTRVLTLSDDSLRRLEVVVSGYETVAAAARSTRASDRPTPAGRPAIAGELLSVRASGSFTVGSWYDKRLDPAGYPGGEARSYNLKSFETAPHACAIALIGTDRNLEGLRIGSGLDFVAGHSGVFRLGLNDKDLSNNEGQVVYSVARGIPTAAQWSERGRRR